MGKKHKNQTNDMMVKHHAHSALVYIKSDPKGYAVLCFSLQQTIPSRPQYNENNTHVIHCVPQFTNFLFIILFLNSFNYLNGSD